MKKKLFIIILLFVLVFIITINIPVIQINHQESENDYSNWMKENIVNDIDILDLKMLGAHDAFSSEINIFSKADIYSDSIMKGVTGTLLKGFLVRQSVTQIGDTQELLKSGVRYFDIRLTYEDGKWTTKHNFTSSDFSDIIEDFVKYLKEYDGEVLVLDFQHIGGLEYDSDEDYKIFYDMLEQSGLLEYNYTNELKTLGQIKYNEITLNKTQSNVIIIDKFTKEDKETYHYDKSILSNWPNNDNFEQTIQFLVEESIDVNNLGDYEDAFIVMQAVTTIQMSLPGIAKAIKTWSLVERAESFNNYLLEHEDFPVLLESYQIIMVDYANSNSKGFVDNIMEVIIDLNTD